MSPQTKKALKISFASVCLALWTGFIFSNSLKSRIQSANQSEAAEGLLRRVLTFLGFSGNVEAVSEIAVRKAAHMFEFFVLFLLLAALFALFAKGKSYALTAPIAIAFVCACIDESLQIISHRGASVKDVLIDSAGIALGALLYILLNRKRIK